MPPPKVPIPPTVSARTDSTLTIAWAVDPALAYVLTAEDAAGVTKIVDPAVQPVVLSGLTPNSPYLVRLAARNGGGTSAPSSPATGWTRPPTPAAAPALFASIADGSVTVGWDLAAQLAGVPNLGGLLVVVGRAISPAAPKLQVGHSPLVSGVIFDSGGLLGDLFYSLMLRIPNPQVPGGFNESEWGAIGHVFRSLIPPAQKTPHYPRPVARRSSSAIRMAAFEMADDNGGDWGDDGDDGGDDWGDDGDDGGDDWGGDGDDGGWGGDDGDLAGGIDRAGDEGWGGGLDGDPEGRLVEYRFEQFDAEGNLVSGIHIDADGHGEYYNADGTLREFEIGGDGHVYVRDGIAGELGATSWRDLGQAPPDWLGHGGHGTGRGLPGAADASDGDIPEAPHLPKDVTNVERGRVYWSKELGQYVKVEGMGERTKIVPARDPRTAPSPRSQPPTPRTSPAPEARPPGRAPTPTSPPRPQRPEPRDPTPRTNSPGPRANGPRADRAPDVGRAIESALDHVLRNEGGFVDHRSDRGGATNFGVTIGTLRSIQPGATVQDLRNLTRQQAREIFRQHYVARPGIAQLPSEILPQVIDMSVHVGPRRAIQQLQRALRSQGFGGNLSADGIMGPATAEAARQAAEQGSAINNAVADERQRFLNELIQRDASQRDFERGWRNRVDGFRTPSQRQR